MISGFNHLFDFPNNGKPAILPYGEGSVLFNNVDGEFENPFFEVIDGKVVRRKLPNSYLSGVCLPVVELSTSPDGSDPVPLNTQENAAMSKATATSDYVLIVYKRTSEATYAVPEIFGKLPEEIPAFLSMAGVTVFENPDGIWYIQDVSQLG